jgi:hypothetical protein
MFFVITQDYLTHIFSGVLPSRRLALFRGSLGGSASRRGLRALGGFGPGSDEMVFFSFMLSYKYSGSIIFINISYAVLPELFLFNLFPFLLRHYDAICLTQTI